MAGERTVGLELYTMLTHKNPERKTACLDELHARIAAARHLEVAFYIKVVAFNRTSGRTLWTKVRIGKHLIHQPGDLPNTPADMGVKPIVEVRW